MSIYITGDVHGDFSELQQWCCAMESTPDGHLVNEQGAWVENGTVQQQALAYDMSVNVTNDVKYDRYSQYDMVDRDLAATYLSICDSTPTLYNDYFDSNENVFNDGIKINYVIAGTEGDTTGKIRTDYSKLSQEYDERGINTMVLDMLNSTKEENAAKYTVFASSSSESYDADHPGALENITYSNHVMIMYNAENRATAAYIGTSSNDDQRSLYKYAPKDSDFPRQGDEVDLAEKLNEYAKTLGCVYDGYNYVRTDGVKTYNINPSYGEVDLRFNNEDGISVYISGLGKKTNYTVGILKSH